ncbi:MAG: ion transporter [Defluviitaleaceae bacterium]|nr:ion transporter [Defluviitaleaceae bacterium]
MANRIFSNGIAVLIIVNIVMVVLDILEFVPAGAKAVFEVAEWIAVGIFTVEYAMRLWTANMMHPKLRPFAARLKYARTPMAIIDVVAVVPNYLFLFLPFTIPVNTAVIRILRFLRLLRLMKLKRYSEAKTVEVVFASIKESIVQADTEFNFLNANEAANKLFPSLRNKRKYTPIHQVESWPKALMGLNEKSAEFPILFEIGENHYRATINPIYDDDKLLRYVIIIRDITEAFKLEMLAKERMQTTAELITVMKSYGEGDFDCEIKTYGEDWAWANDAFTVLRESLKNAVSEFESLAMYAGMGYFSMLASESKFKGSWAALAQAMNNMVVSVEKPLADIEYNAMRMSSGDFTTLPGEYQGRFESVISACNRTNEAILAYINEIAEVLGHVAKGNYAVSVESDYIGAFAPVKTALNQLLDSLNNR